MAYDRRQPKVENHDALPNLIDERTSWHFDGRMNGPVYSYRLNKDGSIHVRACWAGMGDGIGAGGKRFATIEDAAEAVRAARAKVSPKWSKARKRGKYPPIPHSFVN